MGEGDGGGWRSKTSCLPSTLILVPDHFLLGSAYLNSFYCEYYAMLHHFFSFFTNFLTPGNPNSCSLCQRLCDHRTDIEFCSLSFFWVSVLMPPPLLLIYTYTSNICPGFRYFLFFTPQFHLQTKTEEFLGPGYEAWSINSKTKANPGLLVYRWILNSRLQEKKVKLEQKDNCPVLHFI